MSFLDDVAYMQHAIGLLIGIPMIVAGLRLFKLWLAILGFLMGGIVGAFFGLGLTYFLGFRGDGAVAMALILAVTSGVVGALLAWPLQKLIVFVTAGFLAAVATFAGTALVGMSSDLSAVLAFLAFFGGGSLSVWAYQYLIIISLAAGGASSLFHALVTGGGSFRGATSLDELVTLVTLNAWQYILILTVAVLFALYVQRWSMPRATAGPSAMRRAFLLQRGALLFGFLVAASYLAFPLVPRARAITLLGPLVWMALALLLPMLLDHSEKLAERFRIPANAGRYLVYPFVALIVTPFAAWAQGAVMFGRMGSPAPFLTAGFGGPETTLKLAYAFLILPLLGMMMLPASTQAVAAPAAVDLEEPEKPQKLFRIFEGRDGRWEAVKEGWSWPAFCFYWIWAMVKGLWGIGIGTMLAVILSVWYVVSAAPQLEWPFTLTWFGVAVVFGLFGNEWRSRSLASRGWTRRNLVTAGSPTEAIAAYVRASSAPDVPGERARTPQEFRASPPVRRGIGLLEPVEAQRSRWEAPRTPAPPRTPVPKPSMSAPVAEAPIPSPVATPAATPPPPMREPGEAGVPTPGNGSRAESPPSRPSEEFPDLQEAAPPSPRTFTWPERQVERGDAAERTTPEPRSQPRQPGGPFSSHAHPSQRPPKETPPSRLAWPDRTPDPRGDDSTADAPEVSPDPIEWPRDA